MGGGRLGPSMVHFCLEKQQRGSERHQLCSFIPPLTFAPPQDGHGEAMGQSGTCQEVEDVGVHVRVRNMQL